MHNAAFNPYLEGLRSFIASATSHNSEDLEDRFNRLALQLFALQFDAVPVYRNFCKTQGVIPQSVSSFENIPAVPAGAFKDLELTSLGPEERTTVFNSSGTTGQTRSQHFHSADSLKIYEASLLPWFERHFLSDWSDIIADRSGSFSEKPGIIFLTPSPALAPHSSLVHMFETVRKAFASPDSIFAGSVAGDGSWHLEMDRVMFGLRKSMCANRPICLLGTAFLFVHLLDHFDANNIRYKLAAGSRILETGGYKGRSRELPKNELHQLLSRRLGVPQSHIACEYGMSELSSQAYDIDIGQPQTSGRLFRLPPWARFRVISPETGRDQAEGQPGLLRLFDLANVRSVMAIQTEDLAVRRGDGFELLGRAMLSEPRGCSLMSA